MELAEILVKAKMAVEEAELPEDLREVAFAKAVELLSVQQVPSASGASNAQVDPPKPRPGAGQELPAAKLASKLDLEERLVSEIIYFGDDGVEILVSTNSLESTTAGATRELALLVAGARQLSDREEWTSIDVIRQACEHFGRYDKDNFAATIRRLDAFFSIRGSSRERTLKLRKPGEEELKRLFERLAGDKNA